MSGAGALARIVSGGQTGVDRGALDAALARGFPCGGWCPAGRAAEDGAVPPKYPLAELAGAGYRERTLRNVEDSDGTVILHFGRPSGGTALTARYCRQRGRPHMLVDAAEASPEAAAARLAVFCRDHGIVVLNVAGPRASGSPGAHGYAFRCIDALLAEHTGANGPPAASRA